MAFRTQSPADRVRLCEVTCFVDLPCGIFGVLTAASIDGIAVHQQHMDRSIPEFLGIPAPR